MSKWMGVVAAIGLLAVPAMSNAQDMFYAGKSVDLIIGANAGGANDAYARLLARHMPRFIPGSPTIVTRNMGGAGGAVAATYLAGPARQDGSVFGMVTRALLLEPLMSNRKFAFNILDFHWLGSLSKEHTVVIVNGDAPATTFADARMHEVILGAAGAATDGVVYPNLMNQLAGTKFRVVSGYAGSEEMNLAMERREIHGRGGVGWSAVKLGAADKLASAEIKVLVQLGLNKHPDLLDVPTLLDFVTDEISRSVLEVQFTAQEMGRPFLLPPGFPAKRVELFRTAFNKMALDPQFLKDANAIGIEIDLLTGTDMQSMIERTYKLPRSVIDLSRKFRS